MESRFEYLNILHTSCCLFVLGIFEIKKKNNTNQDIIQPRKGIRPATINLHNIFISGRFQLYTFFCWDSTHNTFCLKGKKIEKPRQNKC